MMNILFALVLSAQVSAEEVQVGPIQKVLQLLSELQTKVIKEGETEQASYETFVDYCSKQALVTNHAIEDSKEQIEELTAKIDGASSEIEDAKSVVAELSAAISANENEHKKTKDIRDKEHKDFIARDESLGSTVDMLTRAHSVLEKNLKSVETPSVQASLAKLTSSLSSVVDASFVSLEDHQAIESLIQRTTQGDDANDLDLSLLSQAPQAKSTAYEGSAGPILDTISSLIEKAETSRSESQKEEMANVHAFDMFDQSMTAEIASQQSQLDSTKKRLNKNEEIKAAAEGELDTVKNELGGSEKYLEDTQQECMEKASEWETKQAERAAELKVLAEAKKILSSQGEGLIQAETPPMLSFLQIRPAGDSSLVERQLEASKYLREQGNELGSQVLAQVGERLGADPFAKVKDMVTEMVSRLKAEQAEEASHNEWCTTEMAKSTKSYDTKKDRVEELATRVEKAQAESAKISEQTQTLLGELQDLDEGVKKATEMRNAEHAEYTKNSAEHSMAQKACAAAIKVLRQYYEGKKSFMQTDSTGKMSPAAGIIGLLETAEADFSRMLAEASAEEEGAQAEYDQLLADSKVSRATKEQDLKGKHAAKQRVDNLLAETAIDSQDAQKELDAVKDYIDKLKGSCETKAPSFEERQARRKKELDGLQNALGILDGTDIAFVQNKGLRR